MLELSVDCARAGRGKTRGNSQCETCESFQSETSRHRRVVESISKVEVLDDSTVAFHLKEEHATLLSDLEIPILRAEDAHTPPMSEGL